jgi:tRNA A-37 threonylcarbamoyl transferase component Bud32
MIFDVGQSSFQTKGRLQTEREVLALWRREGFNVPKILSPAFLSEFHQPCLAMEFIKGQSLGEVLQSKEVSLDRKKTLISTFCRDMGRRHERALESKEIRLLVFHPNVRSVLVSGDRLVYIDFETVFTPKRDLERIVRKEIAGFFYSLAKHNKQNRYALMEHFIAEYPSKTRMNSVLEELRQFGTVPFYRWQVLFPQFFPFYKKYRRIRKGIKTFDAHTANGKHS